MLEFAKKPQSAAKGFLLSGAFWFMAGAVYGMISAIHLAAPEFFNNIPFLVFGRTRPVHVNTMVFGFVGYGMRKAGFPIVPMVMGFVLGKLLELYFLQSLMISDGSLWIFLTRPISLVLFILTLLLIGLPLFRKRQPPAQAQGGR